MHVVTPPRTFVPCSQLAAARGWRNEAICCLPIDLDPSATIVLQPADYPKIAPAMAALSQVGPRGGHQRLFLPRSPCFSLPPIARPDLAISGAPILVCAFASRSTISPHLRDIDTLPTSIQAILATVNTSRRDYKSYGAAC